MNSFLLVLAQNGLKGCGLLTAISLAQEGYGKTLLDGINRNKSTIDVAAFLVVWRESLIHELQTNQSGSLHKRLPVLAASIPLSALKSGPVRFLHIFLQDRDRTGP